MMVGVLGILKAGAAYLPLDPSYPPQRLRYMLEDSQVALLVTRAEISVLPTQGVQCVYLQDLETRADLDTSNPQRQLHSQQLAYVIYTSGSTGQPKGVMVEHRGLCNLAQAQREVVQLPRGSRLLQFSSLSFDIWMWDFLLAIGSGSALCVVTDPWQCSGAQLVQQMVAYEVTALTLPPSVLSTLPTAELPSLKTVIVGAEVCSAELVRRWAQGRRFFNGYGPTEASVTATMAECRADGSKPTIGRAFRNVRVYVLDSALSPVAPGVPGEVYIGGVGVARGYLNRPELTAQRFIEDPFTSGERLYRTGDRARYLYNGELEFLGRIDDQVKVRGYRVEPQEVAILLKAHSAVQDAAVVVETRDDQPARLVAYVALKPDHEATRAELRSHLARSLPDYMLPSATVFLPALPLTPNGKLDPTALPRLDSQRPELDQPFVAPSSPTELMIAQIWARALQIERIGVHDDFFDLGGHSLLATQVASRLEDAFGHPVPVRTLFESPTIAKLAERMVATNETTVDHVDLRSGTRRSATIPRRTNPATFPTSFGQDRIWFLEQLNPRSPAYIICSAVRVGPVSFDILKSALGELMNRHDVLRARFEQRGGVPIQLIEEALQPPLMRVEYCTTSEAERATIARRLVEEEYCSPFELTKAPLFRATLAVFDDADHLLVIAIHHIIADAWSMSILFKELAAFYDHLATGRPADLPSLPIQYSDYAAWQRELFSRDGLRPQLDYWRSALAGAPPTTTLPLDFPRPPAQQFEGMRQSFVYSPTLYAAIQRQARRHGASSYMVMLAAFIATLAHFSGAEDLVIGSPIAARNRIETESLIGFFANTVAIRSRLSRDLSFEALLVAVREATLLAHANQDVPFDAVVNALQVTRTRSHNPVFQVLFNLQSEDTVGLRDSDPQLVPAQVLLSDSPVLTRGFPKFDLELGLTIVPHAICVMLEYNSSLFLDETITRFALDYRATIEQVTANPELRLCDIRFTNRSVQSLPELEEETLFSFEEATA
jgi:amino acid adenylation domain-containing protein